MKTKFSKTKGYKSWNLENKIHMMEERIHKHTTRFHDPCHNELADWCMIQSQLVLTERESSSPAKLQSKLSIVEQWFGRWIFWLLTQPMEFRSRRVAMTSRFTVQCTVSQACLMCVEWQAQGIQIGWISLSQILAGLASGRHPEGWAGSVSGNKSRIGIRKQPAASRRRIGELDASANRKPSSSLD